MKSFTMIGSGSSIVMGVFMCQSTTLKILRYDVVPQALIVYANVVLGWGSHQKSEL